MGMVLREHVHRRLERVPIDARDASNCGIQTVFVFCVVLSLVMSAQNGYGGSLKRRGSPPRQRTESGSMPLSRGPPVAGLSRKSLIRGILVAAVVLPTLYIWSGSSKTTASEPLASPSTSRQYFPEQVAQRFRDWNAQHAQTIERHESADEDLVNLEDDIPVSTYDGGEPRDLSI